MNTKESMSLQEKQDNTTLTPTVNLLQERKRSLQENSGKKEKKKGEKQKRT